MYADVTDIGSKNVWKHELGRGISNLPAPRSMYLRRCEVKHPPGRRVQILHRDMTKGQSHHFISQQKHMIWLLWHETRSSPVRRHRDRKSIKHRRNSTMADKRNQSSCNFICLLNSVKMPTLNDHHYFAAEVSKVALPEVLTNLPDQEILQEFSDLYEAIIAHARRFYTTGPIKTGGASQIMIEQASAGVLLPWPQIIELLNDSKTRMGVLAMCIGRTMLSRSLMLRVGATNSLGATFLPPELVDCFQSFCIGKSVPALDGRKPKRLNLALLSRWKQISATLLHTTYVEEAFSPFDGRTINIERAIEDLDPLLSTYAADETPQDRNERVADLRDVLRKGARFAFMLFSQPCLWMFDWYDHREMEACEGQLRLTRADKPQGDGAHRFELSREEIVIWPTLLRVVDEKGCKVAGKGHGVVCGEKVYLEEVLS